MAPAFDTTTLLLLSGVVELVPPLAILTGAAIAKETWLYPPDGPGSLTTIEDDESKDVSPKRWVDGALTLVE
jgi:hypothetical protein